MQSACMDSHPPSLGGKTGEWRLGSILCRVIRVRSAELHFLNLTSRATGCCEGEGGACLSPVVAAVGAFIASER